jgi:putative hydrolase of the HAD superfamily
VSPVPVDAVFLDVGGVLALPEPSVLLPLVHAAGAPGAIPEDLRRGHYAGVAAMDRKAKRLGVTADWPGYYRAVAGELPVQPGSIDAVVAALRDGYAGLPWTGSVPGAVEALRRLAATGASIGIISNSDGTVEEQLLRTRVCQVGAGEGVPVALVLDSFVVGIEKPDPAIFRHALDALGVPAARAVHVGDTGWADVEGARAAGVRPLHLDPFSFCPIPDDHEHVADLDDVTEWVTARRGADVQ